MDDPEDPLPAFDSSKSWVERGSLRSWASEEQTLLQSLNSRDREEMKQTITADEQAALYCSFEHALHLRNSILRKVARLSPQRLLYPELLRLVFIQLANDQKDEFTFPRAFERSPAIFRVCRRWRQIALDTGELFACLDLTKETPKTLGSLSFSMHMRRWLSLSREAALDISYARDASDRGLVKVDPLVWLLLVHHFPRWKIVNLGLDSFTRIDAIRGNQMSSDRMTSLSIDLRLVDRLHRTTPIKPLKLPNLRTMHLKVYDITHLSLLRNEFDTPVSTAYSLTLLLIPQVLENEYTDVLHSFSGKITDLTIFCGALPIFHIEEDGEEGPTCLRLPDLQSCKIRISLGCICPCLFSECPKLTTLSLDQDDISYGPGGECSAVLRTVTSLSLGVWYNESKEEDISRYLSRYPGLEVLGWNAMRDEPKSFTGFLQALKNENCCPRLASTSITNGSMNLDELLNLMMLRSQLLPSNGVFRVTLSKCHDIPDAVLADLAELRAKINERESEIHRSEALVAALLMHNATET